MAGSTGAGSETGVGVSEATVVCAGSGAAVGAFGFGAVVSGLVSVRGLTSETVDGVTGSGAAATLSTTGTGARRCASCAAKRSAAGFVRSYPAAYTARIAAELKVNNPLEIFLATVANATQPTVQPSTLSLTACFEFDSRGRRRISWPLRVAGSSVPSGVQHALRMRGGKELAFLAERYRVKLAAVFPLTEET